MKNKFIKNKKMGFIILFAVTLSAILLSIALGVANIAFKETSFSTSARDSNDAFLAADTGAECALFYDRSSSNTFPVGGPGALAITCASATANNVPVTFVSSGAISSYTFSITGLGSTGNSCAKVEVKKDTTNDPDRAEVTIISSGYNMADSCTSSNPLSNLHRVERELVISSFTGAAPPSTPSPASVTLECNGADVSFCNIGSGEAANLRWFTTSISDDCTATGGTSSWTTPATKSWGFGSQSTGLLNSTPATYVITCGTVSDRLDVIVGNSTPTVSTPTAASITTTSATLGATVTSLGYPTPISARGVCYGTGLNPVLPSGVGGNTCVPGKLSQTVPGTYTISATGLSLGTTYHYRGYATNTSGTGYSPDATFATLASVPTVTTNSVSGLSKTGATLNGSANPNTLATTGWFRYSTTNPGTCNDTFGLRSPGSGGSSLGSGSSPVAYSSSISGLVTKTTYYYCAISSNAVGTSFGSVLNFITK